VSKSPGGPLTGALSVQVSPATGAPLAVATTETVNVSPVASVRDESVMLSVKFVAVLVIVGASLAEDDGVAVASDFPGGVPLMTGPLGDVVCLLARVCAKVPASMPVAAQAIIMMAATNRDSWGCRDGLGAMANISVTPRNQAVNLTSEQEHASGVTAALYGVASGRSMVIAQYGHDRVSL
jgi:hypothetical protein